MIPARQKDPFKNDIAGKLARYTFQDFQNLELFTAQLVAVGDDNGSPAALVDLIEYISFEFGNDQKIKIKPAMHLALAAHLNPTGDTPRADTIFIDFASIAAASSPIGLGNVNTPSIAVKLKADAGNVTHDHLELVLHERMLTAPKARGVMARELYHTHASVLQGDKNVVSDFPVGELGSINQVVIESANVKSVRVYLGTTLIDDLTREQIDGMQRQDPFKKAQGFSERLILDFEKYGQASEALPLGGGRTFKLEYNYDDTQAVPAGGIEFLIRGYEG